jgi:glycosyltransferase involved in cell wall biosynthesis
MRLGVNGRFYAARLTGVQRVARALTGELEQRVDTIVFVPAGASPAHGRVVRGAQRGHLFEQVELNGLRRAHRCDLLLHPANTAPVCGGPHIVLVHDLLPLTNPEWFTRKYVWWQRHVVRRAIANAAHVCTFTQWSAAQITDLCGLSADRVSVIPQGLAPFTAPAGSAEVRATLARFGLTPPYVLATGFGDPRKNVAFLLPVLSALRSAADVKLVVLGTPNRRVHPVLPLELPAWVQRIPSVTDDELRALYTGALALCFPSRAEGFGRPPLEAMACGTPALVADYAGAAEVLGPSFERLPLDAGVWVKRLQGLLGQRPGVPVVPAAMARLSWSASAESILEIARRLLRTAVVAA